MNEGEKILQEQERQSLIQEVEQLRKEIDYANSELKKQTAASNFYREWANIFSTALLAITASANATATGNEYIHKHAEQLAQLYKRKSQGHRC